MKKYIIFIASAVLMMTACAKEEINTTTGGKEFISIELDAATKTQLSGKTTNWTKGDQVSVTVGDKNLGSLTLTEGNVFQGEIESAGLDGTLQATINYPAGVTTVPPTQAAVAGSFAEEAALLEGTTTLAELRKGNGGNLANKTALLQFSVAEAGDVTFEVGSTKYTVTGCEVGENKIYYACVAPATAKLVARIGGYLSNATTANKTFTAGKIANLGALPAPVVSNTWGVVGTMQTNEWTPASSIKMYEDLDNKVVLKNIQLYKDDEFKILKGAVWGDEYGNNGSNMTIDKNGIYNIIFDSNTKNVTAECVKETTDIKIKVTIQIDRPWNSVNFHYWEENGNKDVNITNWPGQNIGSQKGTYSFEIDGKYIGSQIGYKLHQNKNGYDDSGDQYFTLSSRKENKLTVAAYTLYFKPCANWKQASAWFAIYCWKSSGNAWNGMSKISDDIYGANLPNGYTHGCDMKFVRMDSGKHDLSWDSKWNESTNTKAPTSTSANVCYVMSNGWDNSGGSWKTL